MFAGMRVAVDEAVAEDHRHPRLGDEIREVAPLLERQRQRVDVGELRSLDPLERQHACARVLPVHLRDVHVAVAGEVAVERLRVAALEAVVELSPQLPRELVDEPGGVDEVERAHALLHELRRLVHELDVGLDLTLRVGPLHLHRDGPSVRERRAVHLPDRRGSHRLLVEVEEEPRDRVAELLLDHPLRFLERERAHVVLERAQLGDDVRRNDVGPRRQQLPELHERRTELLEHLPQMLPARGRAALRRRGEPRLRRTARQEVRELVRLEPVPEAVPDHHLRDLRQASEVPRRRRLRHHSKCDTGTTQTAACCFRSRFAHGPGGMSSCSTCRYASPTTGRSDSFSTQR